MRKRLTTRAQNIETRIPMARVTPKPLTGPVPNQMRMEAVMRVVRLASMMVEKADPSGSVSGIVKQCYF